MTNQSNDKDGGAIIYAIICGDEILLIRQPDNKDPKWKLPGETIEPGETLIHALRRGAAEEAGLKIPRQVRHSGQVVLGNSKIQLGELHQRQVSNKNGTHTQRIYAVILKNRKKFRKLGGRTFLEDKKETIRTRIFNIKQVEKLPDFLPQQRPILKILMSI